MSKRVEISDFNVLTDHRLRQQDAFMVMNMTQKELFGDRSFVREGCDCDYCTWEGGDGEPEQAQGHEV